MDYLQVYMLHDLIKNVKNETIQHLVKERRKSDSFLICTSVCKVEGEDKTECMWNYGLPYIPM